MPPAVPPQTDPNQVPPQAQSPQITPLVQPPIFSSNQIPPSPQSHKKVLLIGVLASAILIVGGIFLALSITKSPAVPAAESSQPKPASQKTAPAAAEPTAPATENTAALVPTTYDDGQGQSFKLLFYDGAVQKNAIGLPSDSTMSFIAGNGNVLEQSDSNTTSPLIIYMTTGGTPDGSCQEVFSVTIASAGDVKVCGSDNTLYTMQFTIGNQDYFASAATLSDSDLTSYNDDLKQIFASVQPL